MPVYNRIAEEIGDNFMVFYCSRKEPNREWQVKKLNHRYIFLKGIMIKFKERYIHINLSVLKELKKHNPDVVVNASFNPTMLLGWFYTIIYKKKHIVMSDGWLKSEEKLTKIHFIIRKIVYRYSDSFIGASKHTLSMFEQYGISKKKIFQSCLCIDNKRFKQFINNEKKYDIMFSGQFIERKLPLFFVEVVKEIKRYKKNLNVLLIGSGSLRDRVIMELNQSKINNRYHGFVQQKDLPKYYASSKLLLFPTKSDPWGIVANEACAAGVPVITCVNAGVADDLIVDGVNGYVLPLNVNLWVDKILRLLCDVRLYEKMSRLAIEKVQEYNFEAAAEGFIKACKKSLE